MSELERVINLSEKILHRTEQASPSEEPGSTGMSLSVIVSFYNLEQNVDEYFNLLKSTLDSLNESYEIILIDDNSQDGTYPKLLKIAQEQSHVKLIKMRSRFGEASAFEAGFKLSLGKKIIFYTTRVRPDARDLPKLLAKLDQGYDLVIGWRSPRQDSLLNRFISHTFNLITKMISGLKLKDINSGILAMNRDVLENIQIYGGLNQFIPLLAKKQGYKITEERIAQLPGQFRQSRSISEYLQRSLDILTVIFLTKYSKKPIHFLGFVGGILTLFGGVIDVYLFFYRILGYGSIAGRPLLLLGALSLVIGIQMIAMGLIGEMIIFTHAGDIKEYNIETIIE
ncbi:glycosyltransferase [candidate division KSB1 bacterium]|nr:glycosyltransferase [candidate division KSB1 bacterium]